MSKFNRIEIEENEEIGIYDGRIVEQRDNRANRIRKIKVDKPDPDFSEFYGLTMKTRVFLVEYLKDYSGYAAALRCGYNRKYAYIAAKKMLEKRTVQLAIQEWEKHLATRFINTKERVLKEMSLIAYSDVGDYVDEEGELRVDNLRDLPPQATRAIKKVKMFRRRRILSRDSVEGRAGDAIEETRIDFELYDKPAALVKMGQELGMFRERKELTGADGTPLIPTAPATIIFDFGEDK